MPTESGILMVSSRIESLVNNTSSSLATLNSDSIDMAATDLASVLRQEITLFSATLLY